MVKPIAIFLILVLTATRAEFIAPLLSQQIGGQIFHNNELYMIYVFEDHDPNMEPVFNEYCKQKGRLCAVLSPEVGQFRDFKAFIGQNAAQFFAIIDVQRRKKYVLPVIQGMTSNDLRIFQSRFEQGLLTAFYSSQEPDPEPYIKCQKVVGKSLDKFLDNEAQIKVLFLYTQHSACEVCGEMLRGFADIAQKFYDRDIVIFGYYDIFKNDNPRITDEILPYFLIFSKQSKEPYGLEGDKFHELEQTIIQVVLKDTDIDLDRFRREHTIHYNQEDPQKQYQLNYKLKKDQEEEELNEL